MRRPSRATVRDLATAVVLAVGLYAAVRLLAAYGCTC